MTQRQWYVCSKMLILSLNLKLTRVYMLPLHQLQWNLSLRPLTYTDHAPVYRDHVHGRLVHCPCTSVVLKHLCTRIAYLHKPQFLGPLNGCYTLVLLYFSSDPDFNDDTLRETAARTETSSECRDLVSAVQYLSFQVQYVHSTCKFAL